MGLFGGGDKCAICGEEAGFFGGLTGTTLADGKFLCGSCREKIIPSDSVDCSKLTLNAVKGIRAAVAANKKKDAEFRATCKIKTGSSRDVDCIEIDERHGWFRNKMKNDGFVYNLDDIFTFYTDVKFYVLDGDDRFDMFTFDWPEQPTIPTGTKITDVRLQVWLSKNELGVDKVEFELVPALFTSESNYRGAYACAHEFFEFMRDYRNAHKR